MIRFVFSFLISLYLGSWAFDEFTLLFPRFSSLLVREYNATKIPTHQYWPEAVRVIPEEIVQADLIGNNFGVDLSGYLPRYSTNTPVTQTNIYRVQYRPFTSINNVPQGYVPIEFTAQDELWR